MDMCHLLISSLTGSTLQASDADPDWQASEDECESGKGRFGRRLSTNAGRRRGGFTQPQQYTPGASPYVQLSVSLWNACTCGGCAAQCCNFMHDQVHDQTHSHSWTAEAPAAMSSGEESDSSTRGGGNRAPRWPQARREALVAEVTRVFPRGADDWEVCTSVICCCFKLCSFEATCGCI